MFFNACQKEELNDISTNTHKELSVQNGILVFASQKSFDETVNKVDKMSRKEREVWEKELGFKSLFTIFEEIDDAEIKFFEEIKKLNSEELEKLMTKPDFKRHSNLVYEYIKKGIVSIEKDNGIDYLKFINLPFPKLVNEDGFFLRNNNLIQYTKNKYKVLKNANTSRINELKKLNKNINNDQYFVTDLIFKTNKKYLGTPWSGEEREHTEGKKRITFTETYVGHISHSPFALFSTIYKIEARSYKKYLWSWHADKTTMYLYGSCKVNEGDASLLVIKIPSDSFYTSVRSKTVYSKLSIEGQYIPYVPNSYWVALRNGGPRGIGIVVKNHTEVSYIY